MNGPSFGFARGIFHSSAPSPESVVPTPGIADCSARASKLLQFQPTLGARSPCLRSPIRFVRDESPTLQHPRGHRALTSPNRATRSLRREQPSSEEADRRSDLTADPHAPVKRTFRGDRRELGHHRMMAASPSGMVSPVRPAPTPSSSSRDHREKGISRHRRGDQVLPSSRGMLSRQVPSTPNMLPAGAFHTTRASEPALVTPS